MKEMNNKLADFFETNVISLELSELFDELQEEKAKASALRSALSETLECYEGEEGECIIARMAAYYLALNNGIKNDTYRKNIEKITEKKIQKLWGEDSCKIIEVLDLLLGKTADISEEKKEVSPRKKKCSSPSKLGSKNWKPGDIYAYRLKGEEAKSEGIDGLYVLLYCIGIKKESDAMNFVHAYTLLCFDEELPDDPQTVIDHSAYLPTGMQKTYIYNLVASHKEYPDDELRYLGNLPDIPHPKNERVPPNELFYLVLQWRNFDSRITQRFQAWKKYGEDREKFFQ